MDTALLNLLNDEDKVELLKRLIGFKGQLVTIDQFIHDDYYLGKTYGRNRDGSEKVYEVWRDRLKDIYPDSITTKSWIVTLKGSIGCFVGSTKVLLPNGETRTMEDLYNTNSQDIKIYTCTDDGFIKKSVADRCNMTKRVVKLLKIEVNNKNSFECTHEHEWMLYNNTWALANTLRVGDQLKSADGRVNKVTKIEEIRVNNLPVYDLVNAGSYSNFAISSGDSNIIVHNSGKSTMAKLMIMYDIYKLCMMNDPAGFLGILGTKPFAFKIFNVHKYKAQEMVDEVKEIMENSPFFKQEMKDKSSVINKVSIGAAGDMKDIIGEDVVSVVLSELNFVSADGSKAKALIDQTISRIESRFQKGIGWLNHIILDSSDTTIDSPVEMFLKTHSAARNSLVFSTPIWVAKKQNYDFTETFSVYAGDSEIPAHIMNDTEDTSKYDPERILSGIPKDEVLYNAFDANMELALQEKAGIAVISNSQFFNPSHTTHAFNIIKNYDDIIAVDFYEETDKLISQLEKDIELLPQDRYLFGRLDLGISHDNAGFAIGYIKEMRNKVVNDMNFIDAYYSVPIALAISRYPGQETAVHKIRDLVLQIHTIRPFYLFTTDQFQSSQLRQELNLAGIKTELLSVDRTTDPYKVFKNLVYENKVDLPDSVKLKDEILGLQNYGNKIDHLATNCFIGSTKVIVKNRDKGDIVNKSINELLSNHFNYLILSKNLDTNDYEWIEIQDIFYTKSVDELIEMDFIDSKYYCTPDHRYLTTKGYVEAKNLDEGYDIISYTKGTVNLYSSKIIKVKDIKVYDITTKNSNFILSNGVVVHNSKDIADAVSGLVFSMTKADPEAMDIPCENNPYMNEAYSNMIDGWYDKMIEERSLAYNKIRSM
jgi:intein/homing endonuclease